MTTDGRIFLEDVSHKLKTRIEDLKSDLLSGQKEIENMHDYYWENYTEMDQYGYEDYDNQQALLHQVNANQEKLQLKQRFERMLDSPFFGRVDFLFDGEDDAESFYIGIGNFAERAGMTPLIYDWRAPVSGLFYDYDQGPASYVAPSGTIEGDITSKWQYKIRGGHMIYGFESDMKIDDEILKQELGGNGDVQLKNIVRTIQKEQNAIIRNTNDRILVVQGAAGSGKTSIALHRIAYLLYHDRKHLNSSNVLILSPNSVFSDYISHILPELGEENIREMSFDLFAYRELKGIAGDCEDRYHQIERKLKGDTPEANARFRWKQSSDFIGAAEGFLAGLEAELVDFTDIEYRDVKKEEAELIRLFYYKFQDVPLLARMQAVMEYFIDEYETLRDRDLPEEEIEVIRQKFDALYITQDIYRIYNWLLEENGFPALPDVPYESRIIPYEDVFPILYLKYRLLGSKKHRSIRHLVIDEMQDYSYLQYVILEELFSCRMTILGDKAQTMDEDTQDVLAFLPKIFGKGIRTIEMNKSYRNTMEIAEYACKITGVTGIELFERHGKAVEEQHFPTLEEAVTAACNNLCLITDTSAYETAAILTYSQSQAEEVCRLLEEAGQEYHFIGRDSSTFKKGLSVSTFYLAKGLEFDQVFAVGTGERGPLTYQADYICATRALHELYMYRYGEEA